MTSRSFHFYIDPDKVVDADRAASRVLTDPELDVVSHEMLLVNEAGRQCAASAESFSNSYNVFTLLSQPDDRIVH